MAEKHNTAVEIQHPADPPSVAASTDSSPASPKEPTGPAVEPPHGLKLAALTTGLCLSLFLVGLDTVILSTAIPKITDEYGSINDIGWYGSAYLLTVCTFQLVFGKLYSMLSLKWVYVSSILFFELGSLVCAAAPSSEALIVGRAIAGLGSSGILSGTFTIIALVIAEDKRPAYTGIVGGVYAVASVAGPLLGGVFTDRLTWRWCFWINLPLGAVALPLMIFCFKAPPAAGWGEGTRTWQQKIRKIDPVGVTMLIPAVVCLLLALQWGGAIYPWSEPRVFMLLVVFAVFSAAFVVVQVRLGADATLPVSIATQRTVAAASWFSLCSAGADFMLRQYIPIWFQAIQGVSAVDSGLRTIALILPTALSSIAAGAGVALLGYCNPFMVASSVFAAVGSGLVTTWNVETTTAQWIGYQVLYGLGSGLSMQTPIMAVQVVLTPAEIPRGTALIMFLQTFGGAIFISVAQNIFVNQLTTQLAAELPQVDAGAIIRGGATSIRHEGLPEGTLGPLLDIYSKSLTRSWYLAVALAALGVFGGLLAEWRHIQKPDEAGAKDGGSELQRTEEGEKAAEAAPA